MGGESTEVRKREKEGSGERERVPVVDSSCSGIGRFFLAYEDFGRMFDNIFPA